MLVGLLTISQKDSLINQKIQDDWYFNPVEMIDRNWVITVIEIENSSYPEFDWVKSLPLVEWLGPYVPEELQIIYD